MALRAVLLNGSGLVTVNPLTGKDVAKAAADWQTQLDRAREARIEHRRVERIMRAAIVPYYLKLNTRYAKVPR